ncbi:hypothetical protein [Candidatus Nitrosotenuis aquarius]|uniref:hypothetical protein n=1 Tax=Candidatus Nitrosotenuis aquarius TaxID=1846278 RepID=UPI0013C2CD05|nr:hypothetical protein [Candidatus Nitrosotenuis aquarius]
MRKRKTFRELWNRGGFDRAWISGVLSTIIMLGLFWPAGIAHELGHGIVCWVNGGDVFWPWVFTRLALICDPFPEHMKEVSWAMGGSFGVFASIAPIFIFKFLRKHNFILIGFIGSGFLELGYAIFESTQNELYRINDLSAILPIVLLGLLSIVFFTWSIDKIRERCSRKKSIE